MLGLSVFIVFWVQGGGRGSEGLGGARDLLEAKGAFGEGYSSGHDVWKRQRKLKEHAKQVTSSHYVRFGNSQGYPYVTDSTGCLCRE